MLMPPAAAVTLLVICGLSGLEAVGPVVSNNQWTPVVNSRRVYLSPEVLAKYKQEEQEAQERYKLQVYDYTYYILYSFTRAKRATLVKIQKPLSNYVDSRAKRATYHTYG